METVLAGSVGLAVETSHILVTVKLELEKLGEREEERIVRHLAVWSALYIHGKDDEKRLTKCTCR